MSIPADNPIERPTDDVLGRDGIASEFAEQILELDASKGVVVGVLGAWGSGKTSFVNLARAQLANQNVPILDFNPWMFSGTEQLVESFFIELSSQLKMRPGLEEVGNGLEDYGEAFSGMGWLPFVGPWIERGRGATKLIAKALQRKKQGTSSRRAKLTQALGDMERPIVVVLDDVDRLTTPEIRDVFKLVRLTASFPNIIYIVAFDRARVEQALEEQNLPGRDYLEKIIQIGVDLPAVPEQVLTRQILSALDEAIADLANSGPFDGEVWPDVFMEVIRPLIRHMRDVRRYAAAARGTVKALDGQIALPDLLALEAVRVFLPDVFAEMPRVFDGLTAPSSQILGRTEPPELKASIERLIEVAAERAEVVRAMVERVFPAAVRHIGGSSYPESWQQRWLRERRIAHPDILRLYLERVVGEGLEAFNDAERAYALMADREGLDHYLRALDLDRLQDVVAALENFEDRFEADQVVPGTIVLLNLVPDLPERQGGLFELDTRLVVARVTYRLLRILRHPDAVEAALNMILPEVSSLSAKLEVTSEVGYRENAGHKLVSEPAATQFERAWRDEVRNASIEQLIREPDLLRILIRVRADRDESESAVEIPDEPELSLAIFRAAISETRRQAIDSRAIRRSRVLNWELVVDIFEGEDAVRERFEALRAAEPDADPELYVLIERYLDGWRPTDFGVDDEE